MIPVAIETGEQMCQLFLPPFALVNYESFPKKVSAGDSAMGPQETPEKVEHDVPCGNHFGDPGIYLDHYPRSLKACFGPSAVDH